MKQKRKFLCLHGNSSNAEIHSYQLRQLNKEFSDYEFIPVNGPIPITRNVHLAQVAVPANFAKLVEGKPIYTWGNFFKMNNQKIDDGKLFLRNLVFQEALDYIIKILKDQGPFYGILGFSQGSALAGRIATLIQSKELDLGYQLQCFIFSSGSPNYLSYEQQQLCRIPSIHFVGLNDFLIDRSLGLTSQFLNPLIVFHNQGHKIPFLTSDQIRMLKKYFQLEIQDWPKIVYSPKL